VNAAIENGIPIVPVPGASAVLSALVSAGLPTDSFLFLGFLPPKSGSRRTKLQEVAAVRSTLVAYESPHRIVETLSDIQEVLGERSLILARELTKIHEEFLRGTALSIRQELEARHAVKGEFTLVIAGAREAVLSAVPEEEVERLENEGMARMDAIKAAAKRLGLPKREVYRAVEQKGSNSADRNRGSDRNSQ
jgi:16S rRNA (cytidine1402-2'-O)-methyltransferase